MSKYFPKLTQTHVFIQDSPDGSGFDCPMLPVSALNEMHECSELVSKAKTIAEVEAVRKRLVALVKTVMPEEKTVALDRLAFDQLSELVAYLMYGDEDDQPKSANPKN